MAISLRRPPGLVTPAHSPSHLAPPPWPQSAKKVVSFAEIPGIRDKLPQMAQQLDVCQRALSDFLEDKRSSFPRFLFLGEGWRLRNSADKMRSCRFSLASP